MKKLKLLSVFVLSFFLTYSQTEDSTFIRHIADYVLTYGNSYEDLRILTKQIGGRLSGSPQMYKAEQWGLKSLENVHPDKAWLQECMVPHWVRGAADEARASYMVPLKKEAKGKSVQKKLDVIALGNSFGSGKPLTGEVIEVNDFADLENKKDQLRNKIVFYNYPFNPRFVQTFLAYSDAVRYRGQGPSRAAKYGAKGVIIRSMSHSTDNNPHTGSTNYNDSFPKIPALAIGLRDADWLSKQLNSGKVEVTMNTHGYFRQDTLAHNIIAELSGSQNPNEFITIGGHLDSWDPAEGAHDDGAGVVQTIEVLRVFKALGYKPRHSIRFVLFANEENGGRGGAKYAEEAKAKGEKHLLALESDEGGFTPRGIAFTGTEAQYSKITAWQKLLCPYGACEIQTGGGGSDIGPLARVLNTPLSSYVPDSQRYFDIHHARNDVFENVNKRELELGAVNIAAFIYLVDKYGL
jgi:carboxypeptidase Q